jgi:hypothetical protein
MIQCKKEGCLSKKIRARGLCSVHWNQEQYGNCKNGCDQPAGNSNGFCPNCKKRGNTPPSRKNDGKCNKCGIENLIDFRCPVCDIKRKKNENLVRRYGITLKQFNEILTNQGNVCKICSRDSKRFVIDHDHACCDTKKTCGKCIRGIICENCNRALGLVEDSIEILNNMIRYLKENA